MPGNALTRWFGLWREFWGFLPALVLLAAAGYVLLSWLDPHLPGNTLAWLGELPVHTAYAVAALAVAWAAKHLYLYDLSEQAEVELRQRVLSGDRAARFLLIVDRLEWLVLFGLLLWFFWPPR